MRYVCHIIAVLSLAACAPRGPFGEAVNPVVLCGDNQVKIVDMDSCDGTAVSELWSFNTGDLKGQLDWDVLVGLWSFDECKPVDHGNRLILTCNHATMLLDVATKQMLFYADTPMVHSAELLPGNRLAVANSTHPRGNSLEIYDIDRPGSPVFRDSLYSGHGVVWMEKAHRLFALGYSELREYELVDWKSDTPALHLLGTVAIPVESGHDLTRVDDHTLLLTGHEGVWMYDIRSREFAPFEPLANIPDVKSANYDSRSGRLIYTVAEISWWTHNVYQRNPVRRCEYPDINIYKARPLR